MSSNVDNELRSFSSLKFLRFHKNISLIVEMFWFFFFMLGELD